MKTEKDKNAPEKKPVADKKQEAKATPSIRIRGWRLWVFRVICGVFLPALIFVSLEVALRISGYGYPAKAITECKIKGEKAYCSNGRFGWRFFPPKITRAFHPFAIPSNKPDDTYRIFVLGASAAQGVPDSSYSFGRFLEVMLRQ